MIRARPDLVLITGDVFDEPDPPAGAVAILLRGVRTLLRGLPRTPVLVAAGPRDTPLRLGGSGPLAVLESLPRVEVAAGSPRAVVMREAGIRVLLVPSSALRDPPHPRLAPDPGSRWNVLALVAGSDGGAGALEIDPGVWDWVAVGGRHRMGSPAPRALAPGSVERVGPDPWKEAAGEPGFVVVDLASGAVARHPIRGRPVVEVAAIARGRQTMPRVNARIRAAVEAVPGGVDGKRLRLRVHGITPAERGELDGAFLAVLRRRTAEFQLQLRESEDSVELSPWFPGSRGLSALLGGTEREREALLSRWRRSGPDGLPAPPEPGDRPELPADLLIWRGLGPEDPGAFLGAASLLLSELRGEEMAALEGSGRLREGAGNDGSSVGGVSVSGGTPSEEEGAPELAAVEARLLATRADSVEVDGEVEARTVEWLRERQDAETQLMGLRERARELRDRIRAMEAAGGEGPCPVCGRPLEEQHPQVMEAFREEWEGLVQDGRWWRSRREQLEAKPEALRALEIEGMRLHAELESLAERAEALRHGGGKGAPGSTPPLRPVLPARAALLGRASDLVNRITGGRVAGLMDDAGELRMVMDGQVLGLEAGSEVALARLGLHLALVELALEAGSPPRLLRVGGGIGGLDPGDGVRAMEVLRHLSRRLPGVVVNAPEATVGRTVDRVDALVEYRPGIGSPAGPRLVRRPGGRARVRWAVSDPRG